MVRAFGRPGLSGLLFPQPVATSGRRYRTLDGMRGVAAMVVILWHAAASITPMSARPAFGFLAVDLFFALSGFVLAYSYDRKFAAGLSAWRFMRARFIRLYPLFLLGLVVAVALRAIPEVRDSTTTGGAMSAQEVGVSALFNALMLPAPDGERNHFLFPTNLPAWSLFFEVWVANLALALFWRRLQGRALAAVIAAAGLGILACEAAYHSLDVGHMWANAPGGFARVGFEFFLGVALARIHAVRPPRLKLPSWLVLVVVVAALFAPLHGIAGHLYELACAFLLFPALVYWGAEAVERRPALGEMLGDASYAAYALHVPLLAGVCYLAPQAVARPSELYGFGFVAVVFVVALAAARLYDMPVRAALDRLARGRAGAGSAARSL